MYLVVPSFPGLHFSKNKVGGQQSYRRKKDIIIIEGPAKKRNALQVFINDQDPKAEQANQAQIIG